MQNRSISIFETDGRPTLKVEIGEYGTRFFIADSARPNDEITLRCDGRYAARLRKAAEAFEAVFDEGDAFETVDGAIADAVEKAFA